MCLRRAGGHYGHRDDLGQHRGEPTADGAGGTTRGEYRAGRRDGGRGQQVWHGCELRGLPAARDHDPHERCAGQADGQSAPPRHFPGHGVCVSARYASANAEEAAQFLKDWTRRCKQSRLEPFLALAKRLNRWADGILAFFTYRITNGVSEGINNLIKVLKRRAYGFTDFRYFTLKVLDTTGALPPLETVGHPQF
jgi:hypothetical protein